MGWKGPNRDPEAKNSYCQMLDSLDVRISFVEKSKNKVCLLQVKISRRRDNIVQSPQLIRKKKIQTFVFHHDENLSLKR